MNRFELAAAGHRGDRAVVDAALTDPDPVIRATAYGALARMDALSDDVLGAACRDRSPEVRRRAAELAAGRPGFALGSLLDDSDGLVVEMAAFAAGEHERNDDATVQRLIHLAQAHDDPLVREAAIAALGAIGDERGLPAVLGATTDKPAIRRRAVIALVAFDGDEVDAALRTALDDRDWQVREAAEEILREA